MLLSDAQKKEYQAQFQAKLRQINQQMDELRLEAKLAKMEASSQWKQRMEDLRQKKQEAERVLAKMQQNSPDAWSEVKGGFQKAFGDLQTSFDAAFKHLKSGL
jgi:TolA-binding protein